MQFKNVCTSSKQSVQYEKRTYVHSPSNHPFVNITYNPKYINITNYHAYIKYAYICITILSIF